MTIEPGTVQQTQHLKSSAHHCRQKLSSTKTYAIITIVVIVVVVEAETDIGPRIDPVVGSSSY